MVMGSAGISPLVVDFTQGFGITYSIPSGDSIGGQFSGQDYKMGMTRCEPLCTWLDVNTDHFSGSWLNYSIVLHLTPLTHYGYIPIMAHYNPFPGHWNGIRWLGCSGALNLKQRRLGHRLWFIALNRHHIGGWHIYGLGQRRLHGKFRHWNHILASGVHLHGNCCIASKKAQFILG